MSKNKTSNKSKNKLDSTLTITAGSTLDDNYSLCIQEYDGVPCLCVHKCEKSGGLHWSSMDKKSFVAAIPFYRLKWSAQEIKNRHYHFSDYFNKYPDELVES